MNCQWKQVVSDQKEGAVVLERSSHSVSVINKTLYLFGGENVARTPIDSSIYSFDISKANAGGSWQKIEATGEPPAPRIAHSQAVIGNKIYVFGGRQGLTVGEAALNDLHCFDVDTKKWTEVLKPNETFPPERSFHQMVAIGSSLFVFGGCGASGRLSDLHEFDTEKLVWTKHSNEYKNTLNDEVKTIAPRGGSSVVASKNGDKIFLLGGFAGCGCDGVEMADIYVYDLKSKQWTIMVQTLPTPKSVCIATGITMNGKDHYIVIIGGEVDPSTRGHEGAGGFCNDLILVHEDSLEIQTIKEKDQQNKNEWPLPRGWSAGCPTTGNGSEIIVFGGLTGDDQNPKRLNDLWICEIN